jgi:hypothetical protein
MAGDESSETLAHSSQNSEGSSTLTDDDIQCFSQTSSQTFKTWILAFFTAAIILIVIDIVLRAYDLSREEHTNYMKTPLPECPENGLL